MPEQIPDGLLHLRSVVTVPGLDAAALERTDQVARHAVLHRFLPEDDVTAAKHLAGHVILGITHVRPDRLAHAR